MFEVEAKVPITRHEFERLNKRLQKEAHFLDKAIYKDTYYAKPKTAYIRVRRKRGGDYFFEIKQRKTIKGIESNLEMEWKIKDIGKFRELLRKMGMKVGIKKQKKSHRFRYNDFIIELNHVRLLGHYLEIEKIVQKEGDIPKTKRDLIKLFKELGFTAKDFEARPYLELLANV